MKDKIVHNKNIVSLKAKHEMNLSSLNVIAKKANTRQIMRM